MKHNMCYIYTAVLRNRD